MKWFSLFLGFALSAHAGEIAVTDVEGKVHRPLAEAGQVATVLFFVLHDCPISNGYAPEISRIAQEYAGRGVRSFVVYGEGDLAPAEAQKHAHDYAFRCAALLDPPHALARVAGATVAPEAVVISPKSPPPPARPSPLPLAPARAADRAAPGSDSRNPARASAPPRA